MGVLIRLTEVVNRLMTSSKMCLVLQIPQLNLICDENLISTIFLCKPLVLTVCRGFLLYFLNDKYIYEIILSNKKYFF